MPYVNVDPGIVRTLMARQELTPHDLALQAGVSTRRIHYVLADKHVRVSVQLARAIATALGVPAPVLVDDPVGRGRVVSVDNSADELLTELDDERPAVRATTRAAAGVSDSSEVIA